MSEHFSEHLLEATVNWFLKKKKKASLPTQESFKHLLKKALLCNLGIPQFNLLSSCSFSQDFRNLMFLL